MRIPFNASERSTVGIELELQIVDRDTRQLASAASGILTDLATTQPAGLVPKVKHELFECTLELITGICGTIAEARDDLLQTLKEVNTHTEQRGLALVCAGSHPFSAWKEQQLSPDPRYATLVEEMQWVAQRLQIFGVHFHVGVRSEEKVIAIANGLSAYIPHFLALSASSPYWAGHDTGMASSRSVVFENLPTAGLPYRMSGWDEFEQFMGTLISAQAISSIREVWWDIRPHPDFGTVELRISDGIPSLREVSGQAALAQCLVEWMNDLVDEGHVPPVPREWVLRQNKWRAARHGLEARTIVDAEGTTAPLRDQIVELLNRLSPVAARLGCADELASILDILDGGPSYIRQRQVVAEGGSLEDVVDSMIEELRSDQPWPGR